jgi:hypothetical protein
MQVQNLPTSPKRTGIYETQIINLLSKYFTEKGYSVMPHAQLNISYGCIVSELDMLLEKDGTLTYIEVKSHRDKLNRAFGQVKEVKDYVDYSYVATNRRIDKWAHGRIGLIVVSDTRVKIVKRAKRFTDIPHYPSIFSLRKKCLLRFLKNGESCNDRLSKYELARYVTLNYRNDELRRYLKEIVTCGNTDCAGCPVSFFVAQSLGAS